MDVCTPYVLRKQKKKEKEKKKSSKDRRGSGSVNVGVRRGGVGGFEIPGIILNDLYQPVHGF